MSKATKTKLKVNSESTVTSSDNNSENHSNPTRNGEIKMIPIDEIREDENQPRKTINEEEIKTFATSLEECHMLSPITVTYMEDEEIYRIVTGARRYRAAKVAGWKEVPSIVLKVDPEKRLILQLTENLQRTDLSVIDEAEGLFRLTDEAAMKQKEIARMFGKSESEISRSLAIFKELTPPEKEIVKLAPAQEKSLIWEATKAKDPDLRRRILEGKLTREEVREAIKREKESNGTKEQQKETRKKPKKTLSLSSTADWEIFIKFKNLKADRSPECIRAALHYALDELDKSNESDTKENETNERISRHGFNSDVAY